jgi:thiamine biosynthesis lipoprotein
MLPDSDISRFNRAKKHSAIRCDPWTVRVLTLAALLQDVSGGLFDSAQGSGHFQIHDALHISKPDSATQLNVGGIAKGFAVDRMVAGLRAHGIKSGYVNAGGDLRVFGQACWPIHLRTAQGLPATADIHLQRGSIASSVFVAGRSSFQNDALIDPQHQKICEKNIGVSVAAPRCVFADALTKVVALSGNIHHPALQSFHATAWVH